MKIHSSKSSKIAKIKPSVPSKAQIIQKHLHQALTSFKPAQMLTVLSATLIIIGIGLSCSGKVEQGAILSEGGKNLCIVSECLFKQTKEANERLDKRE